MNMLLGNRKDSSRSMGNNGGGEKKNDTAAIITPAPTSSGGLTSNVDADSNIIDRYKHDMELAKQMRKGMEKRKKEMKEQDVLLGLGGLDKADDLRESGNIEEAFRISEMAIELLIEFLKSHPSVLPTIDRGVVSSRVSTALSNAEDMKRWLNNNNNNNNNNKNINGQNGTTNITSSQASVVTSKTQSSKASKKSSKSSKSSKSKSLSKALGGLTNSLSQYTNSNNNNNKSSVSSNSNSVKTRSSSQPVSRPAPSTTVPKTSRTTNTNSNNNNNNNSQTPSPFYNSKDPMVQTVKSELYVDQSELMDISWDDIAGLPEAKQKLKEAAILPLVRPDLFTGLRKPRNILLYGPPGTGKTMLVKAVAKESQCLLFICTASTLTSKWHGEGEKLLKTLFQVARAAAPSIIFVDEIDALLSNRKSDGGEHEASRRFKTEFMTQVDGIVKEGGGGGGKCENGKNLLLIACTNCPWDIDSAVLRRLQTRIYIPLPDKDARRALLQGVVLPKAGKHNLTSTDIKSISKRLSGFSGSDITSIASEASFGPIRDLSTEAIMGAKEKDIRPIGVQDFDNAIASATKSVSKDLLQKYDAWKQDNAATS